MEVRDDVGVQKATEFQKRAARDRVSLLNEFWHFLRYNKKWWLLPVLIMLLGLGLLVLLSGSAAAPFIYTLF